MNNQVRHFRAWIPDTIKALRTTRGLTQGELASACGLGGASTVSDIEHGKYIPPILTLDRIFTALGVTLTMGFEEITPLENEWIYVRKDTLREIVRMVEAINPEALGKEGEE